MLALCAALLLALPACGQRVKPVSIRNPVLSTDSRRLLADTEDAVSIRRAARDDRRRELRRTKRRREDLVEERSWPSSANNAVSKLRALEDARVELAELELDLAQADLELAQAKYPLHHRPDGHAPRPVRL